VHCFGVREKSCVQCVQTKHTKSKKYIWQKANCQILLYNSGNLIRCRSHDKCLVKHLKPWSEQFACLCTPMRTSHWLMFHFFFFSVSCLPQSLILECLHFSDTTGSLHYDGWMMLQLGRCLSVLLLSVLVVTSFANTDSVMRYMAKHFCAVVLYGCVCDMDHDSVIN